ncbi:diguanylate cyclase domain-containing protein [Candidatus Caldatribacterium saccharofermentans]|uniref:diguanylate cyclase n=1 Tax=Candidatus Caldatribacterium saccharofermentans TaxID=1454753 RepID=A0A7V4TEK0_9BACT
MEHTAFPFQTVTVSIGVATANAGDSADSLLDRADRCLYQAKRAGKNRACADPS